MLYQALEDWGFDGKLSLDLEAGRLTNVRSGKAS